MASTADLPTSIYTNTTELGALCYRVVANRDYVRFSADASTFYRQIVESEPLSFADNDIAPWPELELILRRSLELDLALAPVQWSIALNG